MTKEEILSTKAELKQLKQKAKEENKKVKQKRKQLIQQKRQKRKETREKIKQWIKSRPLWQKITTGAIILAIITSTGAIILFKKYYVQPTLDLQPKQMQEIKEQLKQLEQDNLKLKS